MTRTITTTALAMILLAASITAPVAEYTPQPEPEDTERCVLAEKGREEFKRFLASKQVFNPHYKLSEEGFTNHINKLRKYFWLRTQYNTTCHIAFNQAWSDMRTMSIPGE